VLGFRRARARVLRGGKGFGLARPGGGGGLK
jgi:hypothetical protein